jgi:hypothetical protein
MFVGGSGRNRSFQHHWIQQYAPWLAYSRKLNGALCKYCVLFAKDHAKVRVGRLVSLPLTKYKDLHQQCKNHASNEYPSFSLEKAENFIRVMRNNSLSVVSQIDKRAAEKFAVALAGVECIAKSVIVCARQGIALRGHEDNFVLDPLKDYFGAADVRLGNFNALLHLQISSGDQKLINHLKVTSYLWLVATFVFLSFFVFVSLYTSSVCFFVDQPSKCEVLHGTCSERTD